MSKQRDKYRRADDRCDPEREGGPAAMGANPERRRPPDSARRRAESGSVKTCRRAGLLVNRTRSTPQSHASRSKIKYCRTRSKNLRPGCKTRRKNYVAAWEANRQLMGQLNTTAAGDAFDGRHGTIPHAGPPGLKRRLLGPAPPVMRVNCVSFQPGYGPLGAWRSIQVRLGRRNRW
jgi:hypothetical protein